MQFQVPQFADVEDKIVGPLSLKQFLYIGSAVGLSMLLFFIVKLWLWIILSIFIISGAAALSMIKINGQPLIKIAISAIGFYWRPQTYVWQSETKKKQGDGSLSEKTAEGFSLENIVSGMALKKSWQNLQTGSKIVASGGKWFSQRNQERYEILKKITGERRAARRIDYR
ncbi:MAG: PrgI family protein [Candidatus Liptonbacteria bacterium]|nr:PrgI family protein [Candidatus Liptonbacteria bacterium]